MARETPAGPDPSEELARIKTELLAAENLAQIKAATLRLVELIEALTSR